MKIQNNYFSFFLPVSVFTSAHFLVLLHICEKFNAGLEYLPRIYVSFTYQNLVLCTFVSLIYFLHVASLMELTDVKGQLLLT